MSFEPAMIFVAPSLVRFFRILGYNSGMLKAFAAFLILHCALFTTGWAFSDEKPTVKVGAILSLSGGLEQWCRYYQQGIELAVSGEDPVKIDLIIEDDHSVDKKAALTAAQKLVQIDKVDLLFSWTASTVPVLTRLASEARLPLIIGGYDSNVAKGGQYVFGAFVNYELVPREIAKFFIETKGVRRLGLVLAADDWSQNFEAPFRDEASKLGAGIVFSETISPNEKDLRSLILKLKKENVEAVLAPLFGGSLFSFLKEARELKFSGLIHVGDGMFEEDLKTVGVSSEGVFASQIWVESPELASAFKRRFGEGANPLQLGLVATGYDWVKHVQKAAKHLLDQGKPLSRETLREELVTFQSDGYLGKQMYGAPPSQSGEITMVVKGGRYVRAEYRHDVVADHGNGVAGPPDIAP